MKITDTNGTPEQFMFTVGIGTHQGLVGYIQEEHLFFPKTAQDKSIDIKKNVSGKIRLVLSKPITAQAYGSIEYEAGRDLFKKLSPQLFCVYQLAENLIALIPKDIIGGDEKENHAPAENGENGQFQEVACATITENSGITTNDSIMNRIARGTIISIVEIGNIIFEENGYLTFVLMEADGVGTAYDMEDKRSLPVVDAISALP